MPALPTISPPQAQYDRIVAAFPGATAADKQASYRAWLTNRLIERVELVESQRIDAEAQAARQAAMAALAASLPPRVPEPGLLAGSQGAVVLPD